jgi:hypothetical protein
MSGNGEHMASGHRLSAAERQKRALELRAGGASFDAIAAELGYGSRSGAHKAVLTGLRATLREPADELRTLELERLDAMLAAIWPSVQRGHLASIDRALAIQERRARYLGLDAPARIDVETRIRVMAEQMGLDPDAAVKEAQRILRETKGRIGAAAR